MVLIDVLFPSLHVVSCVLGELFILIAIIRFLLFVKKHFLRKPNFAKFGLNSKGSAWAVITGGSDGIGKVFARTLAKHGFNVFLISRTEEKLEKVAKQIKDDFGVSVKSLAVDFSLNDKSDYEKIEKIINSLDNIGILINNVGINYPYPAKFLDRDESLDERMINVNIISLKKMTHIVLPEMLKKKHGGIINLSSFTGIVPSPMLATYSASKAYIDAFSVSLSVEYASEGISILSITPGLVVSNMSKRSSPSYMQGVVAPQPVVNSALASLGVEQRFAPHFLHAIIENVLRAIPLKYATGFVFNIHKDINRRALAKQKQQHQQTTKRKINKTKIN